MAIALRGIAIGSDVTAASSFTLDLTSLSGGSGSAALENDFVLVVNCVIQSGNKAMSPISGNTSGNYLNEVEVWANDSRDTNAIMAGQFMGATPDTTVTGLTSTNTSNAGLMVAYVFSGVDQTTPFDGVTVVTSTGVNSAYPLFDAGGVTPNTAGAWIFGLGCGAGDGSTDAYTTPTDRTNITNTFVDGGTRSARVVCGTKTDWTSGSFTPSDVTSGQTAGSDSWASYIAVLKPAAGSDTDVSATTDALTLTENAATVSFDVDVTTTTDALTLTEQSATISLDVDVSTTTDSLTLTENTATVSLDVDVSASTDALTITEQAATISLDVDIQASSDILTLTENAATVALGVDVAATTDALTLTENAATISLDVDVQASTDSLTLTEHTATIEVGSDVNVAANTDALTLTENAAVISLDINVNATTDTLTISTNQASVSLDVVVAANTDSLTLTEQSATIGFDVDVQTSTDVLSLTEYAASIIIGSVSSARVEFAADSLNQSTGITGINTSTGTSGRNSTEAA